MTTHEDSGPEQQHYVVAEVAAPYATEAELVQTWTGEWRVVLDGEATIETDEVVVMVGEFETGTFCGWVRTWYSNTETVVVPAAHEAVAEPQCIERCGDELVAASALDHR